MSSPGTPIPTLTPLATLLSSRRPSRDDPAVVQFDVTDDWLQGRTSFGGLIAVFGVQAMRDVAGAGWPLRALQTNFIGPVGPDPVDVGVQVIREGRHVRQVQATVRQNGQVAALLLGVFGAERASALSTLMPPQPLAACPPADSLRAPFIPGIAPNFVQHLDLRWAEGGLPFSGSPAWDARVHLRLLDAQGIDAELLAVMLADAAPTPALARLDRPTPASSVSWSLELRPEAWNEAPDGAVAPGWWRIDKSTHAAAHGYVNESGWLWTPEGRLAAIGSQVVAIYG